MGGGLFWPAQEIVRTKRSFKRIGKSAQVLLRKRVWVSAFLQAALIAFSLNLAWFLRFDFAYPHHRMLLWATLVVVGVRLLAIRGFNLLHGWWDFTDMNDAVDVAKSVVVGAAGFLIVFRYLLN